MTSERVELRGAQVLITGATGGIGHAIAAAFARRGARLILTGRRREPLEALAQELDARPVVCDLDQRPEVESLATTARESRIDVFIANAALPASGVLVELSQAQIDRMLEVNLRAPIALARALAPMMTARGSGHMVFVSSLSGKVASPASSLYSATKFGLRGFALSMRADLRPYGVGASVILPGFVRDAGMFADAEVKLPPGVGTRSPEEVAAAVLSSIGRNRAEVEVAPLSLRLGASLASLAPGPAALVSRWLGSDRVAADMAEAQSDRR